MEIRTVGSGDRGALVVHGNDLCGAFYAPFAEAIARRGVRVDLLTLPGFHRVAPLEDPGWDALVDGIVSVMEAERGPVALIGHSMGGLLALLAAARRPAGLSHLVLLEPTIFPSRAVAAAASRRYLAQVVDGPRDRFDNWNGGAWRAADPDRYPREMIALYLEVRRTSDRTTAERLFRTLPDLYPLPFDRVVPTLVVSGDRIGWRGRLLRALLLRRLRAEHVTLPGAAHWLVNEDDEALADLVAGFLGG